MRIVSGIALLAALIATLVAPAFAAPAEQRVDSRSILLASAGMMDSASSMRFSGVMNMTMSVAPDMPLVMSMPLSGSYQAPDRMTMSIDMAELGSSVDMVMVGGQVWVRTGNSRWQASRAGANAMATPLGMSHAEWVAGLTDPVVRDVGSAYEVSAGMDVSNAMRAGFSSAAGSERMASTVDFTAATAAITLTIDKATNYMTSMQMDLAFPMPSLGADMTITTTMDFTDFNGIGVEINPPV